MPESVCPRLTKIALNPASAYSAEVEESPLFSEPLPLDELKDSSSFRASSIYIVPQDTGFCGYPLQTSTGLPFSPGYFALDQTLPDLFGKPTSLQVPPTARIDGPNSKHAILAGIYDLTTDQVYLPDVHGLKWYLVGGTENYQNLIRSVMEYAKGLLGEWREAPYEFYKTELEPVQKLSFPPDYFNSFRATREIRQFEIWLSYTDPVLYQTVKDRIFFEQSLYVEDCREEIQGVWARYDPDTGKIFFLPEVLRQLQEQDYASARHVLAHEVSHQESAWSGLVPPSEEIFGRSLEMFFHLAHDENPGWVFGSIDYLKKEVVRELSCKRSPQIIEEELAAHLVDMEYHDGLSISQRSQKTFNFSMENFQIYSYMAMQHFPEAWQSLAADYIQLALFNSFKYFLNPSEIARYYSDSIEK